MKIRFLSAAIGAFALAASSLVHAGACLQWDFSRPWNAVQSNGYEVAFRLDGERPEVGGTAQKHVPRNGFNYWGWLPPSPVAGTIDGDTIELQTTFGGRYFGSVDTNGRMTGTATDTATRSRVQWSANRTMNCLRRRPPVTASNDFNRDGRADLLWHNASTGEMQIWFMRGNQRVGRATIGLDGQPLRIGPPWRIAGSRDFDGDGMTDLVWYNESTGETQLWFMADGARLRDRATVVDPWDRSMLVGSPWRIAGTGDLNGDGKADIVWHDTDTGRLQVWLMDRHRITDRKMVVPEYAGLPVLPSGSRVAGIEDMDNDGDADLVVHSSVAGTTQIFQMSALKIVRRVAVRAEDGRALVQVGTPWRVTGADQIDRDGFADIVWHNAKTGETQIWKMGERSLDGRNVPQIQGRFSVNADRDGGGELVAAPWFQMNH